MRRLLLAILIAGLGVLLPPVPAQAGGPTSVLITNQALGRATALVYSDTRYGELERLLADTTPVEASADSFEGASLTTTWLLHDVNVWRTTSILLDAAGGPLVVTAVSMDDVPVGESMPTWGRVNDAPALKALLRDLGMIGRAKPGATVADPVADPVPDPVTDVVTDPVTDAADASAADTGDSAASPRLALTGWRWAFPGLVAGMVLGLLVLPLRRAAAGRSGPRGPRRELIDRAPQEEVGVRR